MLETETLHELRKEFDTASWAVWSDRFPKRGCKEENKDERVKFFEENVDNFRPGIVFLGLNPAPTGENEGPSDYENFHSTDLQHRDIDLRLIVEESGFEGAYMTDISRIEAASSGDVDEDDIDISMVLSQLEKLGQDEYHVFCFGRRVSNELENLSNESRDEDDEGIRRFSVKDEELTLECYGVYHYSQPNRKYTQKLREQLNELGPAESLL